MAEFIDGLCKVARCEVGPGHGREVEFGVGAFPQEEIAEALFAAGANEEIDVGHGGGAASVAGEVLREAVDTVARTHEVTFGGGEYRFARRVVDGDAQVETPSPCGGGFGGGARIGGRGF